MTTVDAVMVRIDADASALRAELGRASEAAERDASRIARSFDGAAGAIDRSLGGTFGRLRRQVAELDLDARGLLRGLLADLALGAAGAGIEGLFGSVLSGLAIPGFAAGGAIGAGQPAIVGEKGPELFVPRSAGTILPGPLARPDTPAIAIRQTFVLNQGADAAAVEGLRRAAGAIKRETLAAVQDAQRRTAGAFV